MESPERYRSGMSSWDLARMNRAINEFRTFIESPISVEGEYGPLSGLCRDIIEVAGCRRTWFEFVQHNETKTMLAISACGCEILCFKVAEATWVDKVLGRTLTGTNIRIERSSVAKNILIEPWIEHIVSQRHYTFRRGVV